MANEKKASESGEHDEFARAVAGKEARKLRARRGPDRAAAFWVGMFGLVGWSVAIPTVLGIALGVWLDRRFPGQISWTLTLLVAGVLLGCWNAWYWVQKESRK